MVPIGENRKAARTGEASGSSPCYGSGIEADLARTLSQIERESCGKKLGLLKSLDKLVRIFLCEQEGFLKGVCNCLVHPSLKGSTETLPGCEQGDFSLLYMNSAVIFTLRSRTQALASFIY